MGVGESFPIVQHLVAFMKLRDYTLKICKKSQNIKNLGSFEKPIFFLETSKIWWKIDIKLEKLYLLNMQR